MKRFFLLAVISTGFVAAPLFSQENMQNNRNGIETKAFFRKHKEHNYSFTTKGIHVKWYKINENGVNYNFSFLTNPGSSKLLLENDNQFFYKVPFKNSFSWYPIMGTKMTHHVMERQDLRSICNFKYTLSGGVGLETFLSGVKSRIEISLFQDMINTVYKMRNYMIIMKPLKNTRGGKLTIGLRKEFDFRSFIDLAMDISMTIPKAYKDFHATAGFGFNF